MSMSEENYAPATESASQEKKETEKTSEESKKDFSLTFTLIAAIITGFVSYAFGIAADNRKSRLDFVNTQIEKLYGPLYSLTQANKDSWEIFFQRQWRNIDHKDETPVFFDDHNPPTVEQARRWRLWMRTVFQPQNKKIEEAIVAHSSLLIGDTMPLVFHNLIAHAEAYEAVIASWSEDDFAACRQSVRQSQAGPACPGVTVMMNTASGLNFPKELTQCVENDYLRLKKYQQNLESFLHSIFFAPEMVQSSACNHSCSSN